ncbi:helix-turn-helix domain-containing protein [Streptomyces flavofungini]|uniref:helix-turn-helix domain-containing protein n=1 Tax=Streptomyces flavofungini TaxID=68200 RepID=UPI0025B21BAB|nr:LysR family transcriptional regulator [Streptomyces flavofungini]WJV44920.1 LysR family transcriptional regulator [Streptomyces flavofungini]
MPATPKRRSSGPTIDASVPETSRRTGRTKGRAAVLERVDLEALLTAAEELHFGRTAERIHLTTGRVSQTIRKLERHIGTPLLERTSRDVRLTPAGRQLYDDVLPPYSTPWPNGTRSAGRTWPPSASRRRTAPCPRTGAPSAHRS